MILIDPVICLAAALYFESRGELKINQLRVAEVIHNRVQSSRYPDNICDVVLEFKQFTFYWDGKEEIVDDKEAWDIAVIYANESLAWLIDLPEMEKVCHYAHKDITNGWTSAFEGTTYGAHTFYKGGC
jgi:spore germination cell wall hydrolase CwlJ-like protein